ncbi:phosphonate C-P lyase system protein PhnH [Amycolatopsis endophytica]|uniref:Alpha-D-ribose 1-methylphosphonate 5-triphosphate synthase subunit PhnH n=1 Tax=Amycolatopsis endophytica TaxID=860233 RepID=A0A853B9B1_9PSEU|nr:phosphonate C-P lyase system protein PhnH [Amycolatopsis endophytica]NYI91385.1 alpha-D-ribose 1-methylphosphonate 5-triphosphate synthase subunit PhnH [Amycolatopsis endophytica]
MTRVLDRIAAATLRPDESRTVFRAVLDALSRPGRVVTLPADGSTPAVLLPVLALADLGTGVAVLDDGEDWADVIGVVTSSPAVPPATARFVAATRPMTPAELRTVRRGSALAPEEGALVCLSVPELDGTDWTLTGPGVDGSSRLSGVDGLREARAEAVSGFPAGIDLLLITRDGRMAGIPRSTTIEGRDR